MFSMTVDDLLTTFRDEVGDSVEPYLWSDAELYRYANFAVNALAAGTNGLVETISLPFAADALHVSLPSRVLHIYHAKLLTSGGRMYLVNENDDEVTASNTFVRDTYPSRLTFTVPPVAADTLVIRCSVTTQYPLVSGDDCPFTDPDDTELLLMAMKWKAYGKHDAEATDPVREAKNKREFELGVQEREVALRNRRRSPGLIKMEW